MKIGVMSDTHGSLTYFEKALDALSDCDVLIPEGYNPKGLISKINSLDNIIIARGNCDADVDQMVINHPIQSPYVMSQFGETRIVTTHGYTDSKEDTINKAKSMGADILILGHTHVKELYLDENLVVLNPGSTSIPKDGTHSVAIIDIIQSEDEIDMNFNLIDINTFTLTATLTIFTTFAIIYWFIFNYFLFIFSRLINMRMFTIIGTFTIVRMICLFHNIYTPLIYY